MSTSPPTWQNRQRRKQKQLCSHYMLWDQPCLLYWRNFAKKRNYNLENEVISKGFNSQKSKGKKTPVFYIWFSVCSHKQIIFIWNICTSYPVPKADGHFCYEGSPLRLHKKILKKKTLVGISFMHIAPDSSWTQILWNGHFSLKPSLDVLVFR
jgi:hypothetical protein